MRTRLDIADDVLTALLARARRDNRAAGELLSEIAREALLGSRVESAGATSSFYGFEPLPSRGPAVSNEIVDRLRDGEAD